MAEGIINKKLSLGKFSVVADKDGRKISERILLRKILRRYGFFF